MCSFKKKSFNFFFLILAFHFVSILKEKLHREELKSTGDSKKQGRDESPLTLTSGSSLSSSLCAGAGPFPLELSGVITDSWEGPHVILLGASSWGVTAISRCW